MSDTETYEESIARQRRGLAELLDDCATRIRNGCSLSEAQNMIESAMTEADSIARQCE
jgi:hypothetical protein